MFGIRTWDTSIQISRIQKVLSDPEDFDQHSNLSCRHVNTLLPQEQQTQLLVRLAALLYIFQQSFSVLSSDSRDSIDVQTPRPPVSTGTKSG